MISAAASAAGPPLVASPYPLSYLQYGQVIQAMPPHYHGQTVYSMLQASTRMLTSGAPPQPMGPGPQYPGQAEGPGPQQAMYGKKSQDVRYLRNASTELLQIWHKHSLGLNEELIIVWWLKGQRSTFHQL
ncbi:ataxin-2-like protein [Seriola lalandi dorsalis]|uniref:ataxin-2-like protein n=1 Tax=Seriola lalandi dorsalis TaxID=1841481 RepID=UPI000C6F8A47|nr:ataxin-2-like protein [Seriola lalandi dorsalis]